MVIAKVKRCYVDGRLMASKRDYPEVDDAERKRCEMYEFIEIVTIGEHPQTWLKLGHGPDNNQMLASLTPSGYELVNIRKLDSVVLA